MHLSKKVCSVLVVSALIVIGTFFFAGSLIRTSAESSPVWLTIDAAELDQVMASSAALGDPLDLRVETVEKGIAIVQSDDAQMARLSSHMHDKFEKCSGFIAHFSKDEALQFINRTENVDNNQSFVTYTIDNQATVNQLIPASLETNVRQMIIDLASFPNRRYNQPSGLASANFIKDKWTTLSQPRPDITVDFFAHPTATSPQPSVILTIPGTTLPDEVVVLGAHQDSINSSSQTGSAPGADDDASGIASLTEAIRVVVEKNYRPARTIKFMAYAAEEVGLRGSNAIAQDFRDRNVNVVGVLQLDMTNFKGSANLDLVMITDFTNAPQNQFIRDLVAAYLPALTVGNSVCSYGCSDHAAWNNRNYAASFPFEASFGQHNNKIHSANDTLAESGNNATHALKFTKIALAYVGELAKGSIAPATPSRARADFDGDGRTDISVFRPDSGVWYLNRSTGGFQALNWGLASDKLVPADYDGDGTTDIAVFRGTTDPSQPDFYILFTGNYTFSGAGWGVPGDIPTIADYDGDGKADISIFRPGTQTWYNLNSSDGSVFTKSSGLPNDRPIVGDFDGDGRADLSLLRGGLWITLQSSTDYQISVQSQFGITGDIPTPADFDGNGADNIGVFRPSNGTWYYLRSDGQTSFAQFGANGDIPVTGDYDGDGRSDHAVFRPNTGIWYIFRSSNSTVQIDSFGLPSDLPLPAAYQP